MKHLKLTVFLLFTALVVKAQVPPKPIGQPIAETVTVLHGTNLMPTSAEMIIKDWIGDGVASAGVRSVNGQTGAVVITAESIGAYPMSGGALNPSVYISIYNPVRSMKLDSAGLKISRLDGAIGTRAFYLSLDGLVFQRYDNSLVKYTPEGILDDGSLFLLPDKEIGTYRLAVTNDIKPESDPLWMQSMTGVLAHTESNHRVTEYGGFEAGDGTVVTPLDMGEGMLFDGVAMGSMASASQGAIAIGPGTTAHESSVALGVSARASEGGAGIGYGASSMGPIGNSGGAALGNTSRVIGAGGAVGKNSWAGDGFAGGKGAQTKDGPKTIDAIQLGTGVNAETNTLKVYNYPLLQANGKIPKERIALTAGDVGAATQGDLARYLPLAGGVMEEGAMISMSTDNARVDIAAEHVTYEGVEKTVRFSYDFSKPHGDYTFATLDDIPDTSVVTNIVKSVGDNRYVKGYNGVAENLGVNGYLALPQSQATNLVLRIITSNEYIIAKEVWE